MITRLGAWARAIKGDVMALWLAARDVRVPCYAKAFSAVIAAYALSPIDLIPDFIPIFGYLDDLLILPLGIMIAVRLIPVSIMAELRAQALEMSAPFSQAGLIAIVLIWLVAFVATIWMFWPHWHRLLV
jgi:uncharacterized membrane protein YkvA (DUF1232 family)